MLQFSEHAIEYSILGPAVHACVDSVPIAEPLRQSTPFAAMLSHIQDGIEHTQVRVIYVTALLRQAVLDLGVLLLGNFHALRLSRICAQTCEVCHGNTLVLTRPNPAPPPGTANPPRSIHRSDPRSTLGWV